MNANDGWKGYDHSYFFISTFATDHVNHAAKYLFA